MRGKGGDLRIELTGHVRVEAAGVIDDGALHRQARLVLAMLAAEAGTPVPRDSLADALWPGATPQRWEKTLAAIVTRIRTALSSIGLPRDAIQSVFGSYELTLPPDATVDIARAASCVLEAERHLADGASGPAAVCAREAAAIARREFLPGEDGEWIARKRIDLRATLVRALETLAQACLTDGDAQGAVAAAEETVSLEQYRESGYHLLMRAHVANGNRAEALRTYERCRALLADELGVDPSPEIEASYLEILREERAPGISAPIMGGDVLYGRDDDLSVVRALVDAEPLVTIVGPGGVGKTSLARAVANARATDPRRAIFVDLAPATDRAGAVSALASAAQISIADTDIAQVCGALDEETTLVVLDNCEHLLGDAIAIVATLLTARPGISVLATSREALGLEGERVWVAPPLRVPSGGDLTLEAALGFSAVQLFVARAAAANPTLLLDEDDVADLIEICTALDGLPLALELAAAHARWMSVADVRRHLGERLDIFAGRAADQPDRHRTLRDMIEWSVGLLTPEQGRFLVAMGVFANPWTLEAAASVADVEGSTALEMVSALIDASLVTMVRTDDRTTRYRMLETVRAYALDRAGPDLETLLERHATWFGRRFAGSLKTRSLAFSHERDDLRSSMDRLIGSDPMLALGVLDMAPGIWMSAGLNDQAGRWIRQLEESSIDQPDLSRAAAIIAIGSGDQQRAARYYEQMMERAPARPEDAFEYHFAYGAWLCQGPDAQLEEGLKHIRLAREGAEAAEKPHRLLRIMSVEGEVLASTGAFEDGEALQRRSIDLAERHEMLEDVAEARVSIARIRLRSGDPGEALALADAALTVFRGLDRPAMVASTLGVAIAAAMELGMSDEQFAYADEGVSLVERLPPFQQCQVLASAGYLATLRSDLAGGRVLLRRALDIARRTGQPQGSALRALAEAAIQARDPEQARAFIDQALELDHHQGWERRADLHLLRAVAALQDGDVGTAQASLDVAREGETDLDLLAVTSGWVGLADGRLDDADAAFALDHATAVDTRLDATLGRAAVAFAREQLTDASTLLRDLIPDAATLPRWSPAIDALFLLARVSARSQNTERAARLLGGAESLRERFGIGIAPVDADTYASLESTLVRALGRSTLERLWAEGRAMSDDRFIAYASAPTEDP